MTSSRSTFAIGKSTVILVGVALLVLLVLNAILIIQNGYLRANQSTDRSIALREGTVVPALSGVDVHGKEFKLEFGSDSRKTLILVFSPRCAFCTKNMPNWRAISNNIDRGSFRVVGVSLIPEGVTEYVEQQGLSGIPVVSDVDPKTRVSYEMTATPQTILVDSHGRVEKVWTGVLAPYELSEASRALNVKLPT